MQQGSQGLSVEGRKRSGLNGRHLSTDTAEHGVEGSGDVGCVCRQVVNLEEKDLEAEYVGVPGLEIFPVK